MSKSNSWIVTAGYLKDIPFMCPGYRSLNVLQKDLKKSVCKAVSGWPGHMADKIIGHC